MNLIKLLLPSSLVVDYGINLDTIVYTLLLTIFSPICVWIFCLFDKVSLNFAVGVSVLWISRSLNFLYKRCDESLLNQWRGKKNKTVLITGGGSGLGFELVKKWCCRRDVAKVIVLDVKFPEETTRFEHEKLDFIRYDCTNTSLNFIDNLSIELAEIDVLVCNAGVRQLNSLDKLDDDSIQKIVNVNWISHMLLIKRYIECIEKNLDTGRKFHVVVIGSVLGFVGPKKLGVYAGTKNALLAMMDALREELSVNIVLSTVLPGQLDSKMFADVKVNRFLAPVINVDKLSTRIVKIVDQGLNGTFAYPSYGRFLPIYRILPWCLQRFCSWFSGMDVV